MVLIKVIYSENQLLSHRLIHRSVLLGIKANGVGALVLAVKVVAKLLHHHMHAR